MKTCVNLNWSIIIALQNVYLSMRSTLPTNHHDHHHCQMIFYLEWNNKSRLEILCRAHSFSSFCI
ncbi:hypothetical protein DERF_006615 [Dermatophagoides farinae]|uniref:Uncharacterized protein n=1 Tax=Dermatophagoides farinae TaxID=6954 RepID=A0A922I1Q4_DERFA|nr:hypothetical protein DERF_006615 [Dermatophagoides farinae]